ncbi:hypothetical protein [Candidatus Phycosocius spiralis]|uniref:hypothetical protein n=1 Tax=Candidatus Phycosocius spiralis TaxID=2815099 RepID=UPI0024E1501A|nr:hypothetical protein [Candidatus Phycosocius spiralis]
MHLDLARPHFFAQAIKIAGSHLQKLPSTAARARIGAFDACYLAAKAIIQVQHGMGFTWEVDYHFIYRRTKLLAVQAGAPALCMKKLVQSLKKCNAS